MRPRAAGLPLARSTSGPSGLRQPAVGRHAKGFSAGGKSTQSKAKAEEQEDDDDEEEEEEVQSKIVKDARGKQQSALTSSKLRQLRDKTLAQRQKREREIDEYEYGKAMIAKYGPKAGVMPEKVAKRVAKRGMVIGGAFYGTMLAAFGVGIFLFKTFDIIIPPTLMAFITLSLLVLTIAGSSYGMMSASWEEEEEGSVLGLEEFGSNMAALGDGVRRGAMQEEYEKALTMRKERRKLLKATEAKKRELLEG